MNNFKAILVGLIVVAFFLLASYGGWVLKKSISYNFYYRGQVEQTVRDLVKPECLK